MGGAAIYTPHFILFVFLHTQYNTGLPNDITAQGGAGSAPGHSSSGIPLHEWCVISGTPARAAVSCTSPGRHCHSTLLFLEDLHSNLAVIAVIFCRNARVAPGYPAPRPTSGPRSRRLAREFRRRMAC
jgi:hypothetical protein